MKIDLNIYNRILFGDLRPWLKENQSETKFQQKLTPSFRVPKGGGDAFEKAILNALKDHPILLTDEDYIFEIEEDKIKVVSVKDEIFEPLIDIDIPPHFNHKTEFYYYLIKNEGTRLMNNLNKAVQVCSNENEAKFLINTTLIKVKTFLKDTATHLKEISYSDNLRFDELPKDKTEAQKKISDYILSVLQTTLFRLLLEMQQTFEAFITGKILSEDEIYISLLGKTPPSIAVNKMSVRMNDFIVKRYINTGDYSKEKTLDLINDSKELIARYYSLKTTYKEAANRKAVVLSNIQALENLYFVREFGFAKANPDYETIISEEYTEPIFAEANATVLEKFEEINLANKRLAAIIKEEQRLSFLQAKIQVDESAFALSIPRKIALMLAVNKAFVNENLKIDFSKLAEAKTNRIKTNLSVPQVALLFKLLNDLKPEIFDIKAEAELHRFISANFITKKSGDDGISIDKLRQLFNQPDSKAAEFWFEKLSTMMAAAKKIYKV
jgi:hypothetical protein